MKPVFTSLNCTHWYLKYIGLPLTVGVAIYAILGHISNRKRRAALRGKVKQFYRLRKRHAKRTLDFFLYL